eukprot:2156868-Pleurochrysis_carterae.AAC.2
MSAWCASRAAFRRLAGHRGADAGADCADQGDAGAHAEGAQDQSRGHPRAGAPHKVARRTRAQRRTRLELPLQPCSMMPKS